MKPLAVLLLCVIGCSSRAGPSATAGNLTAGEEKVKAYILDNADDPKSVEFASWGPHELKGQAFADTQTYRVRYRAKNKAGVLELNDELFGILDGKVMGLWPNFSGDDWTKHYHGLDLRSVMQGKAGGGKEVLKPPEELKPPQPVPR